MSKLNELPVKKEVVHQLAVGESQTSIAEQVGVDQSTISRFAKEDAIRQQIEEEREKLVKVLPDAVQNVKDLVTEMPSLPKDDIENRKLSYNASKDVLKATNIFPSSQFAHNIYNDNRQQNAIISPNVLDMFAKHAETLIINGEEDEENSQDS